MARGQCRPACAGHADLVKTLSLAQQQHNTALCQAVTACALPAARRQSGSCVPVAGCIAVARSLDNCLTARPAAQPPRKPANGKAKDEFGVALAFDGRPVEG